MTIVEFFDPSCESCRTFYPVVKQILNRYPDDVRLILRYAPFHQGSDEAVGIIEAARRQNVFIPVLEALLEKQPEWAVHGAPNLNRAWNIAAGAGLNIEQAKQDLSTMNVSSILEQDMADIRANNVRATPTFFINGKPLSSFGQRQLIEAVDNQVTLIKGN
ncbi:MAG TPA: thioredoxin domain-containing protein [Alphaproteobacteria bacterium]|nr:thioredoxin domain-containing protein [Alphaproteobacteria bacterium]